MNTENKRAYIYAVNFVKPSACAMTMNYKANEAILLSGVFTKIENLSKILLEEQLDANGILATIKFTAICSDTSEVNRRNLMFICGIPIILKVDYSNDVSKVVGSIERPVIVTFTEAGNPTTFTLSFQRIDRGLSPIYKSF